MPTGYTLPYDTPLNKQAKANSIVTSNVREPQILKNRFNRVKCYDCISSDVPISVD